MRCFLIPLRDMAVGMKKRSRRTPILESLEERLQLSTVTPSAVSLGSGSPLDSAKTQTLPLSISLPASADDSKVDVAFLLDDTGSFANSAETVERIFSNVVTSLQTELPGVDLGFGVSRFRDYGGPGNVFSQDAPGSRPFILDQPIVTAATAAANGTDLNTLIIDALLAKSPGDGGDIPEPDFEGLFQLATGAGFDGDGNGSKLNSGPAGSLVTASNPGVSGDVPPYSSNVGLASGSLGGIGWRPDTQHIVILVTDTAPVAAFSGSSIPATITGFGGVTVPTDTVVSPLGRVGFVSTSTGNTGTGAQPAVVPAGAATVQETVNALNAMGIEVIGMGPSTPPWQAAIPGDPTQFLSAISRLTGAVDERSGEPLVVSTTQTDQEVTSAMVGAIKTVATQPIGIGLSASSLPAGMTLTSLPGVVPKVGPGGTATINVTLTVNSIPYNGTFNANFVNTGNGSILGTVPFSINLAAGPGSGGVPDGPTSVAPPGGAEVGALNAVAPIVVSAQRVSIHGHPVSLMLTFNVAMNAVSVQNVNNYVLLGPNGGLDPILTATYDPKTHSVTLRPKKSVNVHYRYTLQINARGTTALTSALGVPLDGRNTGHPGYDYVASVRSFQLSRSTVKAEVKRPHLTKIAATTKSAARHS